MPTYRLARCLVLFSPLLGGCLSLPARVESRLPPRDARGTVIVAGGAGGRQQAPLAVAAGSDAAGLGLYVRSFDWGHGLGRGLADITDADHARRQGLRLAEEVMRQLADQPGRPVSLVGYSAGAAVVLAAADALPPDSLERVVLLAPAVSPCYDLRRPLASARRGVDVFVSERDWFWLGVGTTLAGTPDGDRGSAAGRFGFRAPGDPALAGRLRQHPWHPSVAWTGNDGGHTGVLEPAFLRAYVLPLLAVPEQCAAH